MGEHDDIAIRDLHKDLELIKSKATACPDFQIQFIAGRITTTRIGMRS
jgi:hypothetical protein